MKFKKTLFYLTTILLFNFQLNSQENKTITLAGVDPVTTKKIFLYDELMPNRNGDVYFEVAIKNSNMKAWTLKSNFRGPATYNRTTKKFNINLKRTITEKAGVKFDKPIKIRISVKTTMGNSIWTVIERKPIDIEKPIILDQYTGFKYFKKSIPKKRLKVNLSGVGLSQALYNKIQINKGEELDTKGQGWFLFLKNKGQSNWTAGAHQTTSVKPVNPARGLWNYSFSLEENKDGNIFNMYKPMVVLVGIPTNFGNVLWVESEYYASMMSKKYDRALTFKQFTGKLGDLNASLSISHNPKGANLIPFKGVNKTNPRVVNKPSITRRPINTKKRFSNNTITFSSHQTKLMIENIPDSAYNKIFKSTLLEDGNIMIGQERIGLEAGTPIEYNPGLGYVLKATVKKNQTVKTKYGLLTLKGGSEIKFYKRSIKAIQLNQDIEIEIDCGKVPIKAADKVGKFDMIFDANGNLNSAYLASDSEYNINGVNITIPEGSIISLQRNFFKRVSLSNNINATIGSINFSIKSSNKSPSIWFDTKTKAIETIIVERSPDMNFDGFIMPVKIGSKLKFEYINNMYMVKKFAIDQKMNLTITRKNGKRKQKTAKEGRYISIVSGKIRNITRF